MRSSQYGTHSTPASKKPTFRFGKRSRTPPISMLEKPMNIGSTNGVIIVS